jgi:hypothetical protein
MYGSGQPYLYVLSPYLSAGAPDADQVPQFKLREHLRAPPMDPLPQIFIQVLTVRLDIGLVYRASRLLYISIYNASAHDSDSLHWALLLARSTMAKLIVSYFWVMGFSWARPTKEEPDFSSKQEVLTLHGMWPGSSNGMHESDWT